MKFTVGWLRDHLETEAGIEDLSAALTALGLEVESVRNPAADLDAFTVARVIEAAPHPNADRLKVCRVETALGERQVVCGAPNARTGMKGIFAPTGTTIPGTGLLLKVSKIRDVESNGMLVSEREMGLGGDHTGIIELDQDVEVGVSFATVMGLDDPVIEIAITPNRQDCLGVRGIARDLAAAGHGRFKARAIEPVPGGFESPVTVALDFVPETADACPMFGGRYIRGIKNGPSPRWLQDRLRAIGLRPISALVDMTNFVTHDMTRPLHVFDADTLAGGIRVRLSRTGEIVSALNGREYQLGGDATVIADADGPLALGGIVGGVPSSCSETTVNVFVESALFDPLRTARTGRLLNIESDARYRFERGVDPESVAPGLEVATRLILDMCGGEPSELVVAGEPAPWRRTISFRPSRVHSLGGLDVTEGETLRTLTKLGFEVEAGGEALQVRPPSWRADIVGEADLVEEVTRVRGYGNIPPVPLRRTTPVALPAVSATRRRFNIVRRALAAGGLIESVSWSFIPQHLAIRFGGGDADLCLSNPISEGLESMRPSLLPNLLVACQRNIDRGHDEIGLFELGPVYLDTTPTGQRTCAAGIRRGGSYPRHWLIEARNVDVFDAKADLLGALDACGAPMDNLQVEAPAPAWYHPGLSGVVKLGPKTTLGHFGSIHPVVLDALGIVDPVVGFELFLDALPRPKASARHNRPPLVAADLPAVSRDFAFVVDSGVAAEAVARAARGSAKSLIDAVSIFDVFEGESIGKGRKSIAFSVRLQPHDRTLTDAEIEQVGQKIVAAVAKATGGGLRA